MLKTNKKLMRNKMAFLGFTFIGILAFLSFRIGYIKYVFGDKYERSSIYQLYYKDSINQTLKPVIGDILDRNKQTLATSVLEYKVVLDIRKIVSYNKKEDLVRNLSQNIDIDEKLLYSYLETEEIVNKETGDIELKPKKDTNWYILPNVTIDRDQYKTLEGIISEKNLEHVYFDKQNKRVYLYDNLAASVIGFKRGDGWGLENIYAKELEGTPGRIFKAYGSSDNVNVINVPAVDGSSIITTLDLVLQQFAEEQVTNAAKELNPINASAIIMNPTTGEVLSMASYPSVNINDPSDLEYLNNDTYKNDWKNLDEDELTLKLYSVWRNFNISDEFEPGSIYKPITVAAALESGAIDKNYTWTCNGYSIISGVRISCNNSRGHGYQTLEEVLANSCNTALMDIAQKMGGDIFYDFQGEFGFGQKTGIDLLGETDAKANLYSKEMLNHPVELATSSFGQGFNNTAIQAITAFASLINGGNLMKPYLVSQVIDSSGSIVRENRPEVQKKVISKETSDYLRVTLEKVLSEGTGKKAYIDGYAIGGKTGTAQVGDRSLNEHVLTFMGYIPIEDPQYIVLMTVNRPKDYQDGMSVAPYFKNLMENIIRSKGIKNKDFKLDIEQGILSLDNGYEIPDFIGKEVIIASNELIESDIDFDYIGSGSVINYQYPIAGSILSKDNKVYLYLSNEDGTQLQTVPDVRNISVKEAFETLKNAGFEPMIISKSADKNPESEDEDYEGMIVYAQQPSPEIRIQAGSKIKLILD